VEAVKELAWIQDVDWHLLLPIRLALSVAHIDQHGHLVIAVRMVRDLTREVGSRSG
jgi:hypothetical protein